MFFNKKQNKNVFKEFFAELMIMNTMLTIMKMAILHDKKNLSNEDSNARN